MNFKFMMALFLYIQVGVVLGVNNLDIEAVGSISALKPSQKPSWKPSWKPSVRPTRPTKKPTKAPTAKPSTRMPSFKPTSKQPSATPTTVAPFSPGDLVNPPRCLSGTPFTCGAADPSTCYDSAGSVGCSYATDPVLSAQLKSQCTGYFDDNVDVNGVCAYKGIQWTTVCYNPSATGFVQSIQCSDGNKVPVSVEPYGVAFIPACKDFTLTCTCPAGLVVSKQSCAMLSPTGVPTSAPTRRPV